ncbi:dihydropteroate synthase [Brachybacterium vulturis]|uniref:Dihydropteroate synthase n=2 Tax=Brachybacterium vulturis TaxID=2017484 RepID=A0A291GSZ3_9MICO|nr:dihydropteroate synthase [Brachybacterium vulturis]
MVYDERETDRTPCSDSTVSRAPEPALDAPPPPSPSILRTPRPLPDSSGRVLVMAIVNRTRDSFFDEGRTWGLEAAVAAGLAAARDGADLIDVGGVKFAPGEPVPAPEESDRVVPVVAALRAQLPSRVLLSVDTFHASVARAAVAAGADLINDTTGLSDPQMAAAVAESGASLILTHSAAPPRRPLPHPHYEDVVSEVREFLIARLELALAAGVPRERIVLDPGPDLNKSTVQTLEVMRGLGEFADLGLPLLAALSRKDFVGESLGLAKEERLEGSLAAAAWAVQHGARMLRVHDVQATVRLVRMLEVLAGRRDPVGPLVHNV